MMILAMSVAIGAASPAPQDSEVTMNAFFAGAWGCVGAFSNGKPLEADMRFTPVADGKWLQYEHADRAPGLFKAAALWGTERRSGRLISMMSDSGGGARLFVSDGWKNGKMVLTIDTLLQPPTRPERFTFERESATTFRMTWETSLDAVTWKMGDYLVCTKAKGA